MNIRLDHFYLMFIFKCRRALTFLRHSLEPHDTSWIHFFLDIFFETTVPPTIPNRQLNKWTCNLLKVLTKCLFLQSIYNEFELILKKWVWMSVSVTWIQTLHHKMNQGVWMNDSMTNTFFNSHMSVTTYWCNVIDLYLNRQVASKRWFTLFWLRP